MLNGLCIMPAMNKVRELIAKHGGTTKVASKCGKSAQTVSNWISRRSIPVKQWRALIAAGFTRDELVEAIKSDEDAEAA
jgi:hypothetical protein